MDERLATQQRGHWTAAELLAAGDRRTRTLGFADAGAIAVGQRADLVTLDTASPRTAGTGADEHTAVFAATAADVAQVVVDGRVVDTQRRRRGDRARARRGDRSAVATTPDHRHRRAGHQRPRAPTDLLGVDRATPRSSSRAAGSPGSARPPTRRPPTSCVDAGGRAVLPGFVDSHSPPGLRRRPGAGVRGPDGRGRRTPPAASAPPSPRPARPPTSSSPPTSPGWSPEMRRQGTTTVEIKSGYGLTVHDEARSLAVARQFTDETTFLGAHVVPAEYADDPAATSTWSPARCSRPRRRTPAGSTCSASAAPSTSTRPARSSTAGAAAGLRGRLHANQLGPGPGVRLAAELGLAAVDHCTYLDDADVDALRDSRHHRDPAAGRRVLDPAALPRRAPAARRRRRGRARQRLQPRLLLHQLDAAVHRARGPRDGDDPGRGRARRDGRRRRGRCDRDDVGGLAVGARADLLLLDAPSHVHLAYRPGVPLVAGVWAGGRPVWS